MQACAQRERLYDPHSLNSPHSYCSELEHGGGGFIRKKGIHNDFSCTFLLPEMYKKEKGIPTEKLQ